MARQVVPAYVEIDGQWVQVGTANVDIQMGSADITISDDAPVGRALAAMMASRPVRSPKAEDDAPVDSPEPKAPLKELYKDVKPGTEVHNVPVHTHNPVQHRDGKSPWCNVCGLTKDFFVPIPAFTKNRGMTVGRVIVDEAANFNAPNIHITPPPPPSAAAQLQLIKAQRPEFYTD